MTAAEHRRILLLGAIIALAPMSIDLYLPALPTLQQALGGTAAQGQLTRRSTFWAWPWGS